MKRPSTCAVLVPVAGMVMAFAPGAATGVVLIAAIIFGTCVLDSACRGVREWFQAVIQRAHHRRNIKPPANLFVIGVVLSVVFVAIGFFWNAMHFTVSLVPGRLFMSMLSISAHLLCMGLFVGLLSMLQSAPNFRIHADK
jgi:hypothetical protein